MPFRSLRSKIFLLVVTVLVAVATFVMLTSQHNVTHIVMNSEQHAVRNVTELVERDVRARWTALLNDKVSTVADGRHRLIQTGKVIEATLETYARIADRNLVTEGAAKGMARQWIARLQLGDNRYAFVYDRDFRVLASGDKTMLDQDLSDLRDFKDRLLARAVYEESRDSGYSIAIYNWPLVADHSGFTRRYAYFGYFQPWDWVFAISDSTQEVLDQIHAAREQMEQGLHASLSHLTLARSGFIFIAADDGRMIVPPPKNYARLLESADAQGHTLANLFSHPNDERVQRLRVGTAGEPWNIETVRVAPMRWTIAAAVPESDLVAPARELLSRQLLIFAAMMLVALSSAWLLSARIVHPLRTLTRFARQLPEQAIKGDSSVPSYIAELPERHKDEVGRLAAAFMFMDTKLRENIARLMHETTARERFESELNIARAIQLGLLPIPLSAVQQQEVDVHALMRPAKEVGGDLYDYFVLNNGKLCLVIGDVSDKGVPAALFMAVTRTLIRATAEDETDPAVMMHKINNRLAENNPNMMFVTLLLGVLDTFTGEFQWVNAGHLPPVVIDPCGMVRVLAGGSGPACGVLEGITYGSLSTHLIAGETLVAYTDGVTESMNPHNEQYREDRLLAALAHPPTSAIRLADRLMSEVEAFANGAEQSDDITLIVIHRP
jgi:sigma-B regulation protein RsbU (phosphoserine phosphatase)